jgi:hypothetical protein
MKMMIRKYRKKIKIPLVITILIGIYTHESGNPENITYRLNSINSSFPQRQESKKNY